VDFNTWRESDNHDAKKFRLLILASGDDGTGDMFSKQMQAANKAYSAGIAEGKRLASQTIAELITSGMPRVETRFR